MASVVFGQALLPEGWARDMRLTFEAGEIVSVQPAGGILPGEARFDVGLPGLPNLHSHAFQRGMAGLGEIRGPSDDSFWSWRDIMYRFLGRMTPDDVEAIAAHAFVEMLEGGFTRVGEFHYLHHQPDGQPYSDLSEMANRIAAAAAETGIRLTLLPCLYAHGGFGGEPPTQGQRRFLNDLDRFARLVDLSEAVVATLPGGVLGLAPHSLRAVAPEELAMVLDMRPGAPIHMHASEQVREVEASVAWSGQRPVEWLLDHANVDDRWYLVHAIHMTPTEIRRLAATGAVAGLCPMTEANLGDGTFDGRAWQDAGGRSGIGTDSNVLIGAATELRQFEYAQRLARGARNVMAAGAGRSTGRSLFDTVLAGGSQALGAPAHGLRAGAPADFMTLDMARPWLADLSDDGIIDSWMFAAAPSGVDCVWVHGRQVVVAGQHVDRARIADRFGRAVRRLVA